MKRFIKILCNFKGEVKKKIKNYYDSMKNEINPTAGSSNR